MPPYEAILFDFDGVLVDSEPIHLACWMEVLAPFGIHVDWDTYCKRYIGVDDRLMLAELAKNAGIPFESAWAKYRAKKRLFEERTRLAGFVRPEIVDAVAKLRGEFRTAVVTSSARSEVQPILQLNGLAALLDTAVYGDDVQRHKPAPEPYLLAAERLGVRRALVVEDSPAGAASGRAAGFDVLEIPEQAQMLPLLHAALK